MTFAYISYYYSAYFGKGQVKNVNNRSFFGNSLDNILGNEYNRFDNPLQKGTIMDLNLVLVEPEIPQNTGNIARTCAAVGASLHLVKPLGFAIDSAKLKRAGLDYWDKLSITYYDSLADFMEKTANEPKFYFTTKAPRDYTQVSYPSRVFLIFGKETKGLPEELLHEHPDRCVRLPMRSSLRSLNLSNAVAVGAFEALRQHRFEGLQGDGKLTQYDW